MNNPSQIVVPAIQLLLVAAVVAVAVWPLARSLGHSNLDQRLGVLGLVTLAIVAGWFAREIPDQRAVVEAAEFTESTGPGSHQRRKIFKDRLLPRQVTDSEFVSSTTCRSCHPGQFSTWHQSFHRTMTQVARPDTVIPAHSGQFDGITLESRGRQYQLSRRDDQFWVRMVDPDWDRDRRARGFTEDPDNPPLVDRQIVMTTGSHHQQTYWVASRWGFELLQFPWEFHIGEKLWFPTEDAELRPESPLRYFGHWNSSCIHCHSVAPNPGFLEAGSTRLVADNTNQTLAIPGMGRSTTNVLRPRTAALYSEVAELGISCEACHGPAGQHVAHHQNPARRLALRLNKRHRSDPDPTIVNPARLDHVRSSQMCGRCHSLKMPHNQQQLLRQRDPYRPGDDLEDHYRIVDFDDPVHQEMSRQGSHLYWNDGSCRLGGREFLGQIASKCYTQGKMSCLSCHAMHQSEPNDQLAAGMRGDQACVQCHSEFTGDRLTRHTHHAAGSSGSQCYNCHMPHTAYALFTAIRIHRIQSPKVQPVGHAVQPNACNLCHLDKSLAWTSQLMQQWYGHEPVELDAEERELAAGVLWMLRGDAAQRAIAAWHTGWKPAQAASGGTDWIAPLLARLLDDSYSAIRFIAWQTLKALPEFRELKYNFVGPPAHRSAVMSSVLDDWQRSHTDIPDALPVTSDGHLDLGRLNDLWKRRDQRPVEIPE